MLVLQVQTTIDRPSGLPLQFPIGVPDADLTAFAERLTREGGLMVTKLKLQRERDGYAYVVGMDRMFGYGLKYDDAFKHTHLGWIGGQRD